MKDKVIKQQLSIMQTALDAVFLLLENEEATTSITQECSHESRTDTSTMGEMSWVCEDCGFQYNEEGGD